MSLLRLLTTGKSLVGVRELESRYRLTSQRLLPQFGSAKNPFGNSASAAAEPATAPATKAVPRAPVGPLRPFAGLKGAVGRAQSPGLFGWAKARFAQAGSFWKRRPATAGQPATLSLSTQPVQGELSLDRIKVVRNDLSDADLEVVQVNRSAVQPVVPRVRKASAAGPEQMTWDSVGEPSVAERP